MTPKLDPVDDKLVRAALAGSRHASGQLLERHRHIALALAYRTLGNADDAQDVAQEALVYALQQLSRLRDAGKFASWLRNITLSLCADYRRRRGTRRLGELLPEVLNEISEEKNYVDTLMLRQAIAGLSESHRVTLLLHYVGGWSREEVAALLGIPLNTVRSRLQAAKNRLRTALPGFSPNAPSLQGTLMPTDTLALPAADAALLHAAFPTARILSVQPASEPWMPFSPRIRLALSDGSEKAVDLRRDITATQALLLPTLERLGIPGPRLIPAASAEGPRGPVHLAEVPRGENLLLWALGGTPHRLHLATERAFEGIDRLQNISNALSADPVAAAFPRRTLQDELEAITSDVLWNADPWLAEAGHYRTQWLQDAWFLQSLAKVQAAIRDITTPLVWTHYLHFFPNFYRIQPVQDLFQESDASSQPGDKRLQENPLVEFVSPFGCFGDPLLGLAMVWVYDCYPFVHTGFVEQFLWRRNVTQREFAPRLALTTLRIIARDLPYAPAGQDTYSESLRGWVEQGLGWM